MADMLARPNRAAIRPGNRRRDRRHPRGTQKGEGFEFHLLALGIAITLMITGGGVASVDGALATDGSAA